MEIMGENKFRILEKTSPILHSSFIIHHSSFSLSPLLLNSLVLHFFKPLNSYVFCFFSLWLISFPVFGCQGGCFCGGASLTEPLADPSIMRLSITPHTLNSLMKSGFPVALLEIRATEASGTSLIPGGRPVLASSTSDLLAQEAGPVDSFVVVYPADPKMPVNSICERLKEMNYRNVIEFSGGSAAWASAGFSLNSR